MQRVEGVVQHYDWGDRSFIPDLLGIERDGRPWAELWLGTHPRGESTLDDGTPLSQVSGQLPYLLKVLAAAEPLSLQIHPNAEQARTGFELGSYPDASSKPEVLCALTPFQAFCGFRPIEPTLALLRELRLEHLARTVSADGPSAALGALYDGHLDTDVVVAGCSSSSRPEAEWIRKLAIAYPQDPSVAATILLNHVVLEPGDALRLDAGRIHSYLHGAGIELMGPSDNVVRGGLTSKPIDVGELIRILDPTPLEQPLLPAGRRYELPDAGVALLRLDPGEVHTATGHEISIDLLGTSWYSAPGDTMVADDVTYVVVPLG